MATTTNSEPEAPAEPRKRRQRQSRVSYADLFGRLQAKTAFARTILHEAAEEKGQREIRE